jgi:hypothetical protein
MKTPFLMAFIWAMITIICVCILLGFRTQTVQNEILVIEVHSVNNLGEQIQKEIDKKRLEGYSFREFEVDTRPAFVKAYIIFEK